MKRILLLIPKGNGAGQGKKWNRSWPQNIEKIVSDNLWKVVTPGPLVLAAMVNRDDYEVCLLDEEFGHIDPDSTYDIVAIYTVTPNANRAYSLADEFRVRGAYVVLGGVHAAMCPDEAVHHADTLLLGEAELIWPEFLSEFEQGKPRKIYTQKLGQVNINESPVPAFELLPGNGRKIIPVQTARGCPHGCKFCNIRSIYGGGYRTKTIANVMKEIYALLGVNPRATIYFTDDNFFCSKIRSRELMNEFKNCGIYWYTHTDLSLGQDEDLMELAYKSGCRQVLIGFESVNPANLAGIDENNFKSKNFAEYKNVIKRIQSHGIGVVGSFIVGLEEDGIEVFDQLGEFISETKIYGASITVNTPYPGTYSFNKLKEENRILSYNWDEYTIFQPVMRFGKMTQEELNAGYINLMNNFISQKSVHERLKYMKSQMIQRKG